MAFVEMSDTSQAYSAAGSIAAAFRGYRRAEAQAIGPEAVNQTLKALGLAKRFLEQDGYQIAIFTQFLDVVVDGTRKKAVKFIIEDRTPDRYQ